MPIYGTQLAEWFCERGILAATNRFRPAKPIIAAFHQAIDKIGTLACDREPDHCPVRARRQPR